MSDADILYVYFGSWVHGRRWADSEGLSALTDVIYANDRLAIGDLGVTRRQIVFVRDGSTSPDVERWRKVADAGRARNEANGFGATEVINVS